MNSTAINLLLADDDSDDRLFFREALDELPISVLFSSVHDGEQLMNFLNQNPNQLPSVLFLDLNMPRKNGFECLAEIKKDSGLKDLPVVVFSTSFDIETINTLYESGAQYYIRKPAEFSKLKKVINDAIQLSVRLDALRPTLENFILQA